MKVFAIITIAVLSLAACTTTGEGSRKRAVEVREIQHTQVYIDGLRVQRRQQAQLKQLPDDGIQIRRHYLANSTWKRTVENRLFGPDTASRLTAEDARELTTAVAFVLTSSEEGVSRRWKLKSLEGRGVVRHIALSKDEGGRACRIIRIIFGTAEQWNSYNFVFCRADEERWEVARPGTRLKGDDFSDHSARERRSATQ